MSGICFTRCFTLIEQLYQLILDCAGEGMYICMMHCISAKIIERLNRKNDARFKRIRNVKGHCETGSSGLTLLKNKDDEEIVVQ